MLGIFLDDERTPDQVTWIKYPQGINWTIVRTVDEFIDLISENQEEFVVSFDHDLADFDGFIEKTGLTALRVMCDYIIFKDAVLPSLVFFHTKNNVGKDNMMSYYRSFLSYYGKQKAVIV